MGKKGWVTGREDHKQKLRDTIGGTDSVAQWVHKLTVRGSNLVIL